MILLQLQHDVTDEDPAAFCADLVEGDGAATEILDDADFLAPCALTTCDLPLTMIARVDRNNSEIVTNAKITAWQPGCCVLNIHFVHYQARNSRYTVPR